MRGGYVKTVAMDGQQCQVITKCQYAVNAVAK